MGQNDKPAAAQPPQYNFRGIKVTKCWITRKETASFTIAGQTTYFESSIGIGVESDNPEHTSRIIYEAAHRSLNVLFEQERKNWLSAKIAEAERLRVLDELHEIERARAPVDASAPISASAAVTLSFSPETDTVVRTTTDTTISTSETPGHLQGPGEF